MNKEKV